ncbi:MAG: glycosyltransferase family 9 protein, partial [Planctomycetales bacterium]|nr:glycosyltransferase family 9 protein [Planctomycetales bacterium]
PRVGKQLAPISALDYYLELAATVGADVSDKRPELGTVSHAEATVTAFWQKQGWQSSDRVVVLNTGGAYGAAKDWPAEHFAALAQRLVDAHQLKVAVICGPAERDNARRIVELADRTAVASLADETPSINLSKSVVRRAALLVSTDSGPRHFGSAYGVPTVAIFGPTDPRWSDNHHPQAIDVVHPVDCGPCAKRTCPMGHHRCMRDLTVGQVYHASLTLLEQSPLHRVA